MNKPLISVIIPTKNSEATIGACLKSVRSQTYKDIEIIVVDNNSKDNTKEIVDDLRSMFKGLRISFYNKGPERSAQRNFGAVKSRGDYLLFLDSDMQISNNVVSDCILLSEKEKNLGGIVIPEISVGKSFWAKCKALERSFYIRIDWIETARFISKKVFNELNGFDENLISGEDWDLNQRIKSKYKISRIHSFIKHDEGDLSLRQLLKKKMYYGTKIRNYSSKEENRKGFKSQSNIIKRYKLFFSEPKKLFSNPIIGMGMLFMKTSEFAAMGLGHILKK